uniref:Uncharacterized protein n=1 Tax=Meloidogyne enterolobii TaxID=390850 RepID=A0A6V7Y1B7_MELEN|nr:unnamed protein product [Meloidogyne enterolobii]
MEMDENKKDDEMINLKEIDDCLNISPLNNLTNKNSKFAKLTEYDNGKLGTLHDHLYTTNNSVSSEYKTNSQLGYVLTEPVRSKCPEKCLIKLGQMLTNRSEALGIFPMNDHKIVLMGKESADTFYSPTGETFYCSKKEGQCGADLAIRRYWHLVEMDTIITVTQHYNLHLLFQHGMVFCATFGLKRRIIKKTKYFKFYPIIHNNYNLKILVFPHNSTLY